MAARTITKRIIATKKGPIVRLVGTLDYRGQGTSHPLADVDPVVLCDIGNIEGQGKPPFGMHPHAGLIAVTTVVKGALEDCDNLNGPSGELNEAYDIYVASAGKGICHEEKSAHDGKHSVVQTIFKIPNELLSLPPQLVKVKGDQIPVLKSDEGEIRVNIGRLGDVESSVKVAALPRAIMLRVTVKPNKTLRIPLDEDLEHGFIIALNGTCKIGGESLGEDGGILLFGKGKDLEAEAPEDKEADLLIVAGKPLNEPWVKLLCRNGFLIAKDEATAEQYEKIIADVGMEFSYKLVPF